MATYSYRAADTQANILSGSLRARDEAELEQMLGMQGLTLIDASRTWLFNEVWRPLRFTPQDLSTFSYFLHMIITSGLPIVTGLVDMMLNRDNRKLSETAGLILGKIESGMTLSEAMKEHPGLFPVFYTQMISAGEASGKLESILTDLMRYLEWQMNFKKTVRSAITYPVIVLGAVFLLILLLIVFVFPRLVSILVGLQVEPPLPTRVLTAAASFLTSYYHVLIIGIIAAGVLFRMWLRTYAGRRTFDSFIITLPLIGPLVRKVNLSRYCKTLATLHAAGLNIDRTFSIASTVIGNTVLAESFTSVTESVINGEGIAPSMRKTGAFPSLVIEMVAIAEKTGNLEMALQRVSDLFDREVPDTLKKVITYLEPLIIVFLGLAVLGVLLSVFLPIYKIVGGIRVR